ncbi:MAG: M23 family metallopeptidase [Ruminococcaceae bacterium]|nr:M23 family metallopeptidase [Oscillospiraceae bacterium]
MKEQGYSTARQRRRNSESGQRVSVQGKRAATARIHYRGRHEQKPVRKERKIWQLTVSGMVLVAVIAAKLTMPQLTAEYGGMLMGLIGKDTDFVAAFSAAGRTFSGEGGVGEALEDAYTAVFGSQEVTDPEGLPQEERGETAAVYGPGTTPEDAVMLQEVLGFAYAAPVSGTLTSCFGYRDHPVDGDNKFHYGLDLAAESGTVITSFGNGIVTVVGESSDLGKYVMVSHANGYVTLYAHCSRITASSGQTVQCGDPIAEVGQTGQATGPHLHFELHRGDIYLNPIYYV